MNLKIRNVAVTILIVLALVIIIGWRAMIALHNFFSGENYMKKNMFDKAITNYSEVIKIMPWSAPAYHFRAYAYAQKNDFDRAIADYSKALEIKPSDTEARSNLALVYYDRGIVYYQKKEYDKSWQDIHKAETLGIKADQEFINFIDKLKKASGREN